MAKAKQKPLVFFGADKLPDRDHGQVLRLAEGLCYASVCAPVEMSGEEAAAAYVRKFGNAGTTRGWLLSDDPTFTDGQTNGCACDEFSGTRRHWLLSC